MVTELQPDSVLYFVCILLRFSFEQMVDYAEEMSQGHHDDLEVYSLLLKLRSWPFGMFELDRQAYRKHFLLLKAVAIVTVDPELEEVLLADWLKGLRNVQDGVLIDFILRDLRVKLLNWRTIAVWLRNTSFDELQRPVPVGNERWLPEPREHRG